MADWHPLLDRIELVGSGPGAIRRAYGKDGSFQVERLLRADPVHREIRYTIEETALPFKDWTAALRVESAGASQSRVVITEQYEPTDPNDPAAARIRAFLRAGLDALARRHTA
jgi:hypothetical protein